MGQERLASRLIDIFGEERFKDDPSTLSFYAAGIAGHHVPPLCVVFPTHTEEVVQVMHFAVASGLNVYPVSRGKNYGYGEAQGTASGQIILDLSRMNKVVEVNEELAYAVLQPGVSQEQFFHHLQRSKSRLQLDITGAGLDASVIGNILERGFGHTDYGDRYSRLVRLTAVTPEGKVIRTGFGEQSDSDAVNTYRYGIGPALEGLFSQSNFAVVTEMVIELMPRPEKMCMFILSAKKDDAIGGLVEAIRELKLGGVVNSAVHFANKARAIGSGENKMAGSWNMSGSISGSAAVVRAKKKVLRRTFRKYSGSYSLWFFDDNLMRLVEFVNNRIYPFSLYAPLKDAYDLQKGIPTDHPLQILLNDDNLKSATLNPGQYNTCFLWINSVCAARRESVESLLNLCRDEFSRNGYEFRVTFTAINSRSLIMIANITFPRTDADISAAHSFTGQLYALLRKNGFLPYRAGSGFYGKLPENSADYSAVLKGIRNVMDPKGVLAPGKYRID